MTSRRIGADPSLGRDCQACTLACSLYHEGECGLSLARLAVRKDMASYEFDIILCRHCEPAECLLACPTEALQRNELGALVVMDDVCIQCGACQDACPYGAMMYSERLGRYFKCDLCAGRDDGPLCVQV